MILVEAGQRDERAFDAKLLFASQLAERGHDVVLDDDDFPDTIGRTLKYDAAPFLTKLEGIEIARVLLIGAEDIGDETLRRLRTLLARSDASVAAIGRFPNRQALIGAQSRLAFATGREPQMANLLDLYPSDLPVSAVSPLAAPERGLPPEPPKTLSVFVFLPQEWLEEPYTLPVLSALDNMPGTRLSVVISGKGKEVIKKSRFASLKVVAYTELGPSVLSRQADVAAFYGEGVPGERMAAFAIELMASGKAVIDCTGGAAFRMGNAPILRGPEDLSALPGYLDSHVRVNLAEIGRRARENSWTAARSIARLETLLGLERPALPAPSDAADTGRIVFLPTNGVGLGHAQRCSVIAEALARPDAAMFAAFPSCVPLIEGKGFPGMALVQKSPDHPEEFANDLVNYLRLRRSLTDRDHLVFDGGYVFDSVYRTIQETGCSATWIRRGLWQPGQIAQAQTEREQEFRTVIIPDEAFDELNADYSFGQNIRRVGPIVQTATAAGSDTLRARLQARFGVEFDTLVVSMLGGGVAADRSAQLQSICTQLAPRSRCLHLIVVWPNARITPGVFGWPNTRVVRTRNSLALCRAADVVLSAVGYNSFHEMIYHAVPTIFMPQLSPTTDDQERRARAASERGLADTVLAHEMLLLERKLNEHLDAGRSEELRRSLEAAELRPRGNRDAAALIEEAAR